MSLRGLPPRGGSVAAARRDTYEDLARPAGSGLEKGKLTNCRGRARPPPARHSPWLRPRVAARPPPSLHSVAQLHLCAAAAAAKPGNILAGQRPPLGHRLLPPSRLPRQLTP